MSEFRTKIGKVTVKPSNVITLPVITNQEIPPSRVLAAAMEANLKTVIVLGLDADSEEYFAGTTSDPGLAITLAERFKYMIMRMGDAA